MANKITVSTGNSFDYIIDAIDRIADSSAGKEPTLIEIEGKSDTRMDDIIKFLRQKVENRDDANSGQLQRLTKGLRKLSEKYKESINKSNSSKKTIGQMEKLSRRLGIAKIFQNRNLANLEKLIKNLESELNKNPPRHSVKKEDSIVSKPVSEVDASGNVAAESEDNGVNPAGVEEAARQPLKKSSSYADFAGAENNQLEKAPEFKKITPEEYVLPSYKKKNFKGGAMAEELTNPIAILQSMQQNMIEDLISFGEKLKAIKEIDQKLNELNPDRKKKSIPPVIKSTVDDGVPPPPPPPPAGKKRGVMQQGDIPPPPPPPTSGNLGLRGEVKAKKITAAEREEILLYRQLYKLTEEAKIFRERIVELLKLEKSDKYSDDDIINISSRYQFLCGEEIRKIPDKKGLKKVSEDKKVDTVEIKKTPFEKYRGELNHLFNNYKEKSSSIKSTIDKFDKTKIELSMVEYRFLEKQRRGEDAKSDLESIISKEKTLEELEKKIEQLQKGRKDTLGKLKQKLRQINIDSSSDNVEQLEALAKERMESNGFVFKEEKSLFDKIKSTKYAHEPEANTDPANDLEWK
ncbi:MAG: hypothetical protein K0S74_611 [Chlamydiales bacterium]|jgi:hypothetical protein|nr:hypothetical protein [Chlamydiales bacterium]